MEFENMQGIGSSTIEKLKKAEYTPEKILTTEIEDIMEETGLSRKTVDKLIDAIAELDDKESNELKFDLSNENRYLVAAFKKTVYYKPESSDKELRESFNKYKKLGADPK